VTRRPEKEDGTEKGGLKKTSGTSERKEGGGKAGQTIKKDVKRTHHCIQKGKEAAVIKVTGGLGGWGGRCANHKERKTGSEGKKKAGLGRGDNI